MPTDVLTALEDLARLDGVAAAAERVRTAAAELRWHEGLRRRWREARAETAVRSAVAGAALEGARLPAAWLRERVATGVVDPTAAAPQEAVVLATWRAHAHVGELLPDLGGRGGQEPPAAEVLAGLHRDLTAHLAQAGTLPADAVGRPRLHDQPREGLTTVAPGARTAAPTGAELDERLATLRAVLDAHGAPALARVAVVHGEVATLRPFAVGNGALARLVARLVAVRSGLEPTGVAVLDELAVRDPAAYRTALAGYASGTPDGVAAWIVLQGRAVVEGAAAGTDVAGRVLAGRP